MAQKKKKKNSRSSTQPNPTAPPAPPAPPAPSAPHHMDIDVPLAPPRAASLFSEHADDDKDEDMDSALKEASAMYDFISNLVDDGPMPTSTYNLANIVTSCNGDVFTAWARVSAHYDSTTLPKLTPETLWLDYQAFKALPVDQEDQPADHDEPAVRAIPVTTPLILISPTGRDLCDSPSHCPCGHPA